MPTATNVEMRLTYINSYFILYLLEKYLINNFPPLTNPSAPIRPRPDTRNATSASQCSKRTGLFVQTEPFWLRKDGVIRI